VPSAPFTHLLMDGGMLFVPDDDKDEFYRAYVADVTSGTKLYVVEQKTKIFKFFVDIDYKAKEALSKEEVERICAALDSVVNCGRCCIARARPRACAEGIKTGVHVHWPDLRVTRERALGLRTEILASFPDASEGVDWSKVIDSSVYGGSGLRMLWSHKKPTGDPYLPWKTLGSEEFSKTAEPGILDLFSIRTSIEEEEETQVDEATSAALQAFINRTMTGQRETRVKRVVRHEKTGGWYVQTDSHFCERINTEHKSNHVWFMIQKGIITQRCFDEECDKFIGREHYLPPTVVEQLKDVAPVGSPARSSALGLLPACWHDTFSFLR
jgi:Herpesviridae UL52/UL70 DNA primase/Prim-pol 4